MAEKMTRKVEILCELEKLADIQIPKRILSAFSLDGISGEIEPPLSLEQLTAQDGKEEVAEVESPGSGDISEAIRAYLVRSVATNVPDAQSDKVSRLRQFFGTDLVNSLDPRPPAAFKHARKGKFIPPFFKGKYLSEISDVEILRFLVEKKYGLSSKRHFRELFHGLFQVALKSGIYKPLNPYCANPADELPGFTGRDKPVTVLSEIEEAAQYAAVTGDPGVHFGCQLMIEAGFRLHEILALRPCDLTTEGKIRLILPENVNVSQTRLKTGERTVTVRHNLRPIIRQYLDSYSGDRASWCFPSATDMSKRMTSDAFGDSLRTLNRAANLPWTTQDYRHTFATRRIDEGWNLKTLAQEMGTSVAMLTETTSSLKKVMSSKLPSQKSPAAWSEEH
ncbi:MAG: site-specific integrase [Akkermansiaceae bacterium]|nr:site-specific integrase [Akkermansiaceae bacterium]